MAARPDDTAVTYGARSLTYAELAAESAELAGYLRHLGVAPDDCVGVFVEPSVELMVGVWGVLQAGGAYLPLSPEYPEERLRYMVQDARLKVVFCQDELRARLTELAPRGTTVVTLEDAAEWTRSAPAGRDGEAAAPQNALTPGNLAYIIYTSGSTGRPKGVMIEHRSIVSQMRWMATACDLGPGKVVLQKTPMSFDAAQWEILAPTCGATVVMGSPGIYKDVEVLIETIGAHQVTTLQCVPTLLKALLDTEELRNCTSLTQIYSGGEALSRSLAIRCLEELPGCELVNLYGPTECTINASAFRVDRNTVADGPQVISIGAPVAGTTFHVLDADRRPVDAGEVGELYIGGVQLARGYLFRPELTAERFVDSPLSASGRLYRTGDLASQNADGTVQFAGRADNQVKLRGYRVELDEIALAIEAHDWVKKAAVVVKKNPRTGFQNLIACIELSPKEAALMDQGNAGAHHQSKKNKLQVKAQVANLGVRDPEELAGKEAVDLPGAEATRHQRELAFARKTYRFYEGGEVTRNEVLKLLGRTVSGDSSIELDELDFARFGEILRYFGQFLSDERLLPKYGYASPGALYATQMYFELDNIAGLKAGYYYFHPVSHQLVLIREKAGSAEVRAKIHFVGKKRAIEPVYKNNIQEVLEIETGHMVGLFEEILPGYGLDIRDLEFAPEHKDQLEVVDEDYYLGTFELVPYTGPRDDSGATEIYVQALPDKVEGLPGGQYRYLGQSDGGEPLQRISSELVQKKHVIAINQGVYERSSIGITVLSRTSTEWMRYVELGKKLQHLQMNDTGFGFMSAGYSSKTGNDLPAARRMEAVLSAAGLDAGNASYFFVGGRVSDEQLASQGMKEDIVHMKGPTEMIRDDLVNYLPDYMMPNRVIVVDELPLLANGKTDTKTLAGWEKLNDAFSDRPYVAPRTPTEHRLCRIWEVELKSDALSVKDDFFEAEGDSLVAIGIIHKVNREFQISLPLQTLLEYPTIEKLAQKIDGVSSGPSSRLVRLQPEGSANPVYIWPGLGGYTMNLRLLADRVGIGRPIYGVQAHGINAGETPYPTIKEMAAEDARTIREIQPEGPYTLWGYSFGARVAFETAYQLEQAGEQVDNLLLIAPGSPKVRAKDAAEYGRESSYSNRAYVTILFSVFAGSITHPALEECLRVATDEESFAAFISGVFKGLDPDLTKRIIRIVQQTYEFKYSFRELAERNIAAPVTIFKAVGDDYSFIENESGYSADPPTVIELEADHYSMLKEPDVAELVAAIHRRLDSSA